LRGTLKILILIVKKWWVGGVSNPGPPDLKSDYNGKSQQCTID